MEAKFNINAGLHHCKQTGAVWDSWHCWITVHQLAYQVQHYYVWFFLYFWNCARKHVAAALENKLGEEADATKTRSPVLRTAFLQSHVDACGLIQMFLFSKWN